MLEKTLKSIEEFIKLSPKNLEQSKELSKQIILKSHEIEKYFEKKESKEKYSKIIKKIEKSSQKLTNDMKRSNFSNLKPEWKRLAIQDFLKLKNNVIELQEILQKNKKSIEKQRKRKKYGFEPRNLLNRLENDEDISKSTRSKLSKLLNDLSDKEIKNKIEDNKTCLKRISKLFIMKKEVKNDF